MKRTLINVVAVVSIVILASVCVYVINHVGEWQNTAKMADSLRNEDTRLWGILSDMQSKLLDERVDRPDQLDLEDIKVGDVLLEVHKDFILTVLIVSDPYYEDGDCRIDYIWWGDDGKGGNWIFSGYCSDRGLVPYSGPIFGWNPNNYMKQSGQQSLTPQEVQEAIQDLKPEPGRKPKPSVDENVL